MSADIVPSIAGSVGPAPPAWEMGVAALGSDIDTPAIAAHSSQDTALQGEGPDATQVLHALMALNLSAGSPTLDQAMADGGAAAAWKQGVSLDLALLSPAQPAADDGFGRQDPWLATPWGGSATSAWPQAHLPVTGATPAGDAFAASPNQSVAGLDGGGPANGTQSQEGQVPAQVILKPLEGTADGQTTDPGAIAPALSPPVFADIFTPNAAPVVLSAPLPEVYASGSHPYTQTGFAVMGGNPDEVVVASQDGTVVVLTGYNLSGGVLFRDILTVDPTVGYAAVNPVLATVPGGGVAVAWQQAEYSAHGSPHVVDVTAVLSQSGVMTSQTILDGQIDLAPAIFSSPDGYHAEWVQTLDVYGAPVTVTQQNFLATGQAANQADAVQGASLKAYAHIAIGAGDFVIQDSQAQLVGHAAVTIPDAHALDQIAAAALAGGTSAAVGWVDSGADYVAVFDASTNSFGAVSGLSPSGASDLHLVALSDGGFIVSWENAGVYQGEVFDTSGAAGGIISLAGQVAGIDSHGDLYTVGLNADGVEVLQTYALNASSPASVGPEAATDAHHAVANGGWQAATIDNVSTSSLHYSGGLIT
jgi:hypothetical protein